MRQRGFEYFRSNLPTLSGDLRKEKNVLLPVLPIRELPGGWLITQLRRRKCRISRGCLWGKAEECFEGTAAGQEEHEL